MSKNPRKVLEDLRSDYPLDPSLMGYKSYVSFSILAALTYLVTFNQYSPDLIGSVLYFIPIITGLTYYVFEDSIDEDLSRMLKYLMFILVSTFVLYFGYVSAIQFTSSLQGILSGGSLSIINPVISLAEVLIGIPVTAAFYHSIYVYYQILCDLSDKSDEPGHSEDSSKSNGGD